MNHLSQYVRHAGLYLAATLVVVALITRGGRIRAEEEQRIPYTQLQVQAAELEVAQAEIELEEALAFNRRQRDALDQLRAVAEDQDLAGTSALIPDAYVTQLKTNVTLARERLAQRQSGSVAQTHALLVLDAEQALETAKTQLHQEQQRHDRAERSFPRRKAELQVNLAKLQLEMLRHPAANSDLTQFLELRADRLERQLADHERRLAAIELRGGRFRP